MLLELELGLRKSAGTTAFVIISTWLFGDTRKRDNVRVDEALRRDRLCACEHFVVSFAVGPIHAGESTCVRSCSVFWANVKPSTLARASEIRLPWFVCFRPGDFVVEAPQRNDHRQRAELLRVSVAAGERHLSALVFARC